MKILVMGLPGAGKTTLARALVERLGAVHLNADEMRANVNRDLGFSIADRLEQARRLGWLADKIASTGASVIADFICPTPETRRSFGRAFTIWMDRISESRFADTNRLFIPPKHYDVRVGADGCVEEWAARICQLIWSTKSSGMSVLMIEASKGFGELEYALAVRMLEGSDHALVTIHGADDINGVAFADLAGQIDAKLSVYRGRFSIIRAQTVLNLRSALES